MSGRTVAARRSGRTDRDHQCREAFAPTESRCFMPKKSRPSTRLTLCPEILETRNLLSLLINAKPTLNIQPDGKSVRHAANGAFAIIQPATIKVFGTAQPS